MRKTWVMRPVDEAAAAVLARELRISPLFAHLLIRRGVGSVEQARHFLCAELTGLGDPRRMADLPKAVELIGAAVARGEKILLVGDYDADGLTSSALLFRTLRSLGAQVSVHIPHRMEDGYGLRSEVIQRAAGEGVRLLITTDCGTTSFKELELARSLGMETVVVDHHDLEDGRNPPASAFLNPLRADCDYPEKELASVGVAFTLARGLASGENRVWEHLDLVALGTVADLAPLTGENRILVRAGLHGLRGSAKPGVRALLERMQLGEDPLHAEDVSFSLAPPLNAMGRLGSADVSFQLLTTEDPEEAKRLAADVYRGNRNRAALEREAFRRALAKVAREINFSRDRVIVLEDERWHPGVVGIVATRLANRFHRPTVVIALSGASCRGSARSIRSFHLVEALHAAREHLIEFGGHPGAAGLTIERSRIAPFREAMNRIAHEKLDAGTLTPSLELDAELPLAGLTDELMRDLEVLAPFGAGNPRPTFVSRDGRFSEDSRPAGFSRFGIRLRVEAGEGLRFEAIHPREAAGEGLHPWRLRGAVHLAYSPVWRLQDGRRTIELRLRDLKVP